MNKILLWIVVLIVLILGIVLLMNKNSGKQETFTELDGEPIKIGAIISQTGFAAAFGEMSQKGIALAVKEINSSGGIDGRPVSVTYEDDHTDSKQAVGAFYKLTDINNVDVIIGSNFDFVTQPLFSLAKEKGVVVISPSNPRIAGAFDTNSHSFVMMTEFDTIIRTFKDYLQNTSHKQLGILRFESSFGEQIQKTLNNVEIELGHKPIVAETYKQIGSNDYRTQILKFKQAGVDIIFLDTIGTDSTLFVRQANQLNYHPQILSHEDLQDTILLPDVDPKIFEGAVIVNWSRTTGSFRTKFFDEYGVEPQKSADRAYDSIYIVAQAIVQAQNRSEIPKILESTKFTTPDTEFEFNENHAAALTPVILEIVKNGKFIPLEI